MLANSVDLVVAFFFLVVTMQYRATSSQKQKKILTKTTYPTLKTHQMFSDHAALRATIAGHFAFVFEYDPIREISRFKLGFQIFAVHTKTHSVFKSGFLDRSRKALFS